MIIIKTEAELRHVLSHLINAIEANAKGEPDVALYELDSIEGLVNFADDSPEAVANELKELETMACTKRKMRKHKANKKKKK